MNDKEIIDMINDLKQARLIAKNIQTKLSFYADEVRDLGERTHTDRHGLMTVISDLKDDHLVNIVMLYMKNGGSLKDIPKKYLNEIKVRGFVEVVIERINKTKEEDLFGEDQYLPYND